MSPDGCPRCARRQQCVTGRARLGCPKRMPDGSVFEACSLTLLAEHLRDKRWVDLRVDAPIARDRLVMRVRIVEIRVLVEREDIIVRQEWLEKDEFYHEVHKFDGDAIWRAVPTNYHIEQVKPYGRTTVAQTGQPAPMSEATKGRIFATTCRLLEKETGLPFDTIAKATSVYRGCEARHIALIVLYELTDDDPLTLCKRFGYASQTPFLSARYNLTKAGWFSRAQRVEHDVRLGYPTAYHRPPERSYLHAPASP